MLASLAPMPPPSEQRHSFSKEAAVAPTKAEVGSEIHQTVSAVEAGAAGRRRLESETGYNGPFS